jgi:hypothetical protein
VSDDLPTPRSISRTACRVHVWCKSCRHAKDADLAALAAAVRGDVPLVALWQLRLATVRIYCGRLASEAAVLGEACLSVANAQACQITLRVAILSSGAVASVAARRERRRAAPLAAAQTIRAMSATVRLRTILAPLASPQRTGRGDAGRARPSPPACWSDAPRHPATRSAGRRGIARWSARSEDPLRQ